MLGLGLSLTKADVSGFDPTNLPSLLHWYKFNTGITVASVGGDDNAVTAWADQKGSNNTAPTVTNDKTKMAQLQVDGTILFQSTSDDLVFSSAISLGAFAVYFKIKWDAGDTVASHDLIEGSNDFLKLANPTEARIKIGTGTGSRHDFAINEIVEGNDFVVGFERKSNGDMEVYKDNIKATANDGDSLNRAISNTLNITRMGIPSNVSNWYEVIICNDSLNASDRNELYNYLVSVG